MSEFDKEEAKKFLHLREESEKQQREKERLAVLDVVIDVLKQEFQGSTTDVYLIGSLIQPFKFSYRSDIDIVLKNYRGDRFELWAKLERILERHIEIILFESCSFQEFVIENGLKVI